MYVDSDAGLRSPKRPGGAAAVAAALVIGLFLGLLCTGVIGWTMLSRASGGGVLSRMWSAVTGRTLSIDVSQPTGVDRIPKLQRLETGGYTLAKAVAGGK